MVYRGFIAIFYKNDRLYLLASVLLFKMFITRILTALNGSARYCRQFDIEKSQVRSFLIELKSLNAL